MTIGNEIITNYDIKNEIKYLNVVGKEGLQLLTQDEIKKIAIESLVNERIKSNEIANYTNIVITDEQINYQLSNLVERMGLKNYDDLESILISENYNFDDFKNKILLELRWNQIIYQYFNKQIKIDKDKIDKKLKELIAKEKTEVFLIYEIFIEGQTKDELSLKLADITEEINQNGFESAAVKYSSSPSSSQGGKLGWIDESEISDYLLQYIIKTNPGEITEPIQMPGGVAVIKVMGRKFSEKKIDYQQKMDELIDIEKNIQLTQFSSKYFNQVKNNTTIKYF